MMARPSCLVLEANAVISPRVYEVGWIGLLCCALHFLIEVFGGEVGAVWPGECVELRMDNKCLEIRSISQWLENFSVQVALKIDLALNIIREAHFDHEILDIFGFSYSQYHALYCNGSSPSRFPGR